MFNAHPLISIPDETNLYYWYYKRPLHHKLFKTKISENRVLQKAFGTEIVKAFDELPASQRKDPKRGIEFLFGQLLKKTGKSIWGDKTPLQTQFVPQILEHFPNAGIINMVRDPRAVCASAKRYFDQKRGDFDFWITNNIQETISRWEKEVNLGLEYEKAHPQNVRTVQYEHLVANPETELKSICTFMNLPFETAMLHHHETKAEGGPPQTDWHKETNKAVNTDNVEKWRVELTQAEISQIETQLSELMTRFDYLTPKAS